MKKIIGIFIVMLLIGTVLPVTGIFIDNDFTKLDWENNSSITIDFDQQIEILMKFGRLPSLSTCIIVNDSIAWSNAYGFSDISQQKSATTDTLYMAYRQRSIPRKFY